MADTGIGWQRGRHWGAHRSEAPRCGREAHWGSQAVSWKKRALTDDEGAQRPPWPPRKTPSRQQLFLVPSSCSLPPSSSSRLRELLSIHQNHHQVLAHLLTPSHPVSICSHHFLPLGQIQCCFQEGTFQTLLMHSHHLRPWSLNPGLCQPTTLRRRPMLMVLSPPPLTPVSTPEP